MRRAGNSHQKSHSPVDGNARPRSDDVAAVARRIAETAAEPRRDLRRRIGFMRIVALVLWLGLAPLPWLMAESAWFPASSRPWWALSSDWLPWIWAVMHTTLAFGAVLVRQPGDDIATDRSALRVLQLLVAQLVMVLVWALAMQFSGAGLVSFAAASGLWLASVGTVYIGLAIAPLRGWLFVPHMLWLCYVAILTGVVWLSRTG